MTHTIILIGGPKDRTEFPWGDELPGEFHFPILDELSIGMDFQFPSAFSKTKVMVYRIVPIQLRDEYVRYRYID